MASMVDKRARAAIVFTVAVLVAYLAESLLYYSRYLNSSLKFVPPARPFAVEDVLGLGFGIPWLFFAIAFALGAICWRMTKATKSSILFLLIGVFVLITAVDFGLYSVLKGQVLSM